MKENLLDVLMYLFEHYIDEDQEPEPDRSALQERLADAGFPSSQIDKAFQWLDELTATRVPLKEGRTQHAIRVYTAHEQGRMDLDCRGFLMFLEQQGVLTPTTRELVIERVMALEADEIDLEQLKWVVLMVLFNQPGQEAAYSWLEELVFDSAQGVLH